MVLDFVLGGFLDKLCKPKMQRYTHKNKTEGMSTFFYDTGG